MRAIGRTIAIAMLTSGLLVAPAVSMAAEIDAEKAAMVKTGYLYNFVKLVEWPDGVVDGEYVVGVVGEHPFGRYLAKLASQRIDGRPVRVRSLAYGDDLAGCHVLFLGRGDGGSRAAALAALASEAVLTVGEAPDFAGDGGVIELFLDEDRIGMRVDLAAARERGLRLGAAILSAAEIVAD